MLMTATMLYYTCCCNVAKRNKHLQQFWKLIRLSWDRTIESSSDSLSIVSRQSPRSSPCLLRLLLSSSLRRVRLRAPRSFSWAIGKEYLAKQHLLIVNKQSTNYLLQPMRLLSCTSYINVEMMNCLGCTMTIDWQTATVRRKGFGIKQPYLPIRPSQQMMWYDEHW